MSNNKKRNKEELKKLLDKMSNPKKVLASPKVISSQQLLELSYEMGTYPYPEKMGLEEYESEKHLLQIELLKVQAWVKETGQRVLGIFEGRTIGVGSIIVLI